VFVAGFIGQANLWEAKVDSTSDGYATLSCLGAHVRASAERPYAAGEEASLMVRPEAVRVTMDQPTGDVSACSATVTDLLFQGPVVRLTLSAPDGNQIIAHLGGESDLPMLRPGDPVWASWSPAVSRVLPLADLPPTSVDEVLEEA